MSLLVVFGSALLTRCTAAATATRSFVVFVGSELRQSLLLETVSSDVA